MQKSTFSTILFSAVVLLSSCSKDEPSNNSGNNNTGGGGGNTAQLCTGVADNSYMPLKDKNNWTIKKNADSEISITLNGTADFGGNTWFEVEYNDAGNKSTRYLRKDGNGDIRRYENNTDYMEIPASPSGNMEWQYPVNGAVGKRKVTSVTSQVTTAACVYKDCLIINEYDSKGNLVMAYSYKTGVGLVRMFSFNAMELVSVTLN